MLQPELASVDWTSVSGVADPVHAWCPGLPERQPGVGPGYHIEMWITPDVDVQRAPDDGHVYRAHRLIPESVLYNAVELRGVLEVICRDVGLTAADAYATALEALHAQETGQRPMTPEERFLADRRRASARTPLSERLDMLDAVSVPGFEPERPVSAPERDAWVSGMVPANPALCRHCGRRIVYAYPNWVRDDDEPGHDPSVCARSFDLGHYHEPEVT